MRGTASLGSPDGAHRIIVGVAHRPGDHGPAHAACQRKALARKHSLKVMTTCGDPRQAAGDLQQSHALPTDQWG